MKKICRAVWLLTFLTLLASPGLAFEKVRFAVISDPHLSIAQQKGATNAFKLGLESQRLVETTVAELNKIPDLQFVLVAGDLTQDAEPWNIDALRRILDGLTVPYYTTLGNHDSSPVPSDLKDQPVTLSKYAVAGAFTGKSGGMTPGLTYYSQALGKDLLLITLDSSRAQVYVPEAGLNDYGGSIDAGQMRWLERTLLANAGKTVIVMLHHNLFPWCAGDGNNHHNWGWFRLDNADAVMALFEKHAVAAVFTGHRHISTRYREKGGVFYFVHPSLSTYPMRYTIYEMTPEGLAYAVKDVPVAQPVWDLAKKNFLADKWWRDADQPDTPEGNAGYLELYESPATMQGSVAFKSTR